MASQFQNLKNFIRHGKHARNNQEISAPPAPQHTQSDPTTIAEPQKNPIDNSNTAVQSNNAAADATAAQQPAANDPGVVSPSHGGVSASGIGKQGGKTYDKDVLAKIVAEEKVSRGRLPRYPGLERWILLEKMGDGAFSNVYRARDSTGEYDQIAIKVVRKYELNATQVRGYWLSSFPPIICLLFPQSQGGLNLWTWDCSGNLLINVLVFLLLRVMIIFIRISKSYRKQLRCAIHSLCLLSTKIFAN